MLTKEQEVTSNPKTPLERAVSLVFGYIKSHDNISLDRPNDMIHVVWYNYTLGGWKALLCTNLPDQLYYEVTYNKEFHETYLDVYTKIENVRIPD